MMSAESNKTRLKQLGWGKAEPSREWITPGKRLNSVTELALRRKIEKMERAMVKIATVMEVKADMYMAHGNPKASNMLISWSSHLREALE